MFNSLIADIAIWLSIMDLFQRMRIGGTRPELNSLIHARGCILTTTLLKAFFSKIIPQDYARNYTIFYSCDNPAQKHLPLLTS